MAKPFINGPKKKGPTTISRVHKQSDNKLPEDLTFEIKDAFELYDTAKLGQINRAQFKSILWNFGYQGLDSKDIDEEIRDDVDPSKQNFGLSEVLSIITKRWFQTAREVEGEEMYKIFDKRNRGSIGLTEIKNAFHQYLDFTISDQDIMEFIDETCTTGDGFITSQDFKTKLGYMQQLLNGY